MELNEMVVASNGVSPLKTLSIDRKFSEKKIEKKVFKPFQEYFAF